MSILFSISTSRRENECLTQMKTEVGRRETGGEGSGGMYTLVKG